MNYSKLILRNLFHNPRRTILTLFGIMLSFFLFVAIFTLLESFNIFLKSENAQVNLFFRPVYMSNFIDGQLPEAYLHQLSKVPLVQYLTPYKAYLGTGRSEEENIFVLGVYPDQIPHLRNLSGITPEQQRGFERQRTAAFVGETTLELNQWEVGQEVIIKGIRGLKNLPVQIVGVMDKKSDFPDLILVRYDYLKEVLGDTGVFSIALLRVASPYQMDWIGEVIRQRFENSAIPVEAVTEKGFIESFLSEISSLAFSIKIIAWITLVATLFVAGNTMAMSIRERAVDQGVLRTLGFAKETVFRLYLTESLLLCVLGGMTGGFIGCFIFQKWDLSLPSGGQGMQGLLLRPYWGVLKQVAILSVLMGILSGLPPAYFAMRRKITDTLRWVA